MGWSSGFRAIDDLPRVHWDETEFSCLFLQSSFFVTRNKVSKNLHYISSFSTNASVICILIDIDQVSVTICYYLELRLVTCWSWAWKKYLLSQWVGLGSPLAACLVYRDIIYSVHILTFQSQMTLFVIEDHMLDWHLCQICYSLEIKLLLYIAYISLICSVIIFIILFVTKIKIFNTCVCRYLCSFPLSKSYLLLPLFVALQANLCRAFRRDKF